MRLLFLSLLTAMLPLAAVAQTQAGAEPDEAVMMVAESAADPAEDGNGAPVLQVLDAGEADLDSFLWVARIVAVLADTPSDPAFIQQMREIEARAGDLIERDVVVITDTDRGANSALRRLLRPRGFMLAIIEKDGTIAQRRPSPRDVREINAIIDRFPLRRQEMLERRPAGR